MAAWGKCLALAVLAGVFSQYAGGVPAYARSCWYISPAAAFDWADPVFAGTVVSVNRFETAPGQFTDYAVLLEFKVHTAWKGTPYETMFIRTGSQESACGIPSVDPLAETGLPGTGFAPEYPVYASNGQADLITRTKLVVGASEDIARPGEGQPPIPGLAAPTPRPDAPGRPTLSTAEIRRLRTARRHGRMRRSNLPQPRCPPWHCRRRLRRSRPQPHRQWRRRRQLCRQTRRRYRQLYPGRRRFPARQRRQSRHRPPAGVE